MRQVCNAFVSPANQPTVPQMMKIYRELRRNAAGISRDAGASSMFTARVFSELCLFAAALQSKHVLGGGTVS